MSSIIFNIQLLIVNGLMLTMIISNGIKISILRIIDLVYD